MDSATAPGLACLMKHSMVQTPHFAQLLAIKQHKTHNESKKNILNAEV
jgi:hypothetical protein